MTTEPLIFDGPGIFDYTSERFLPSADVVVSGSLPFSVFWLNLIQKNFGFASCYSATTNSNKVAFRIWNFALVILVSKLNSLLKLNQQNRLPVSLFTNSRYKNACYIFKILSSNFLFFKTFLFKFKTI